ncbi:unnamed protein product [Pleuronectes platessa]|uniref:Uncharacterized protein n=1 Tax=Pleuronectes platessa TaxID=8262 RepID=A0A9N7UG96_PLEPL|nr:unnamed protein product [Pleuronectes platessa]
MLSSRPEGLHEAVSPTNPPLLPAPGSLFDFIQDHEIRRVKQQPRPLGASCHTPPRRSPDSHSPRERCSVLRSLSLERKQNNYNSF